ncbi:hypothetical protein OF83DRAFT_1180236 [Amylostereum chailletii]|nr:hypothetical protein OF83DRAFT_1180236 [Amylostereum chailletii]
MSVDILTHIIGMLPVGDLKALGQSSRALRSYTRNTASKRWLSHISRWFVNTGAFQSVLQRTDAVVSGSCVLAFTLSNTEFVTPADLDLYVGIDMAPHLIAYLVTQEGYHPAFSTIGSSYYHHGPYEGGISRVVHLHRASGVSIDVVVSSRICSTFPLVHFWNTLVLNYVSFRGLCVAYPELTFQGKGCINPARLTARNTPNLITKYNARGFNIGLFEGTATKCGPDYAHKWSCPNTFRSFNDRSCFSMPFGNRHDSVRDNDPHIVFWRFGSTECGGSCGRTSTRLAGTL